MVDTTRRTARPAAIAGMACAVLALISAATAGPRHARLHHAPRRQGVNAVPRDPGPGPAPSTPAAAAEVGPDPPCCKK